MLFHTQLRNQLSDAYKQEALVSAEMERRERDVAEAERLAESCQTEFHSAQETLKRLTDTIHELATEKSKLEFEVVDIRKQSEEAERLGENEVSQRSQLFCVSVC